MRSKDCHASGLLEPRRHDAIQAVLHHIVCSTRQQCQTILGDEKLKLQQ